VPTVLHVIDRLDYRGAARQLTLLAPALAGEGWQARVCALGPATPWAEALAGAGVGVDCLGRRRVFDVFPFLALRRLVRSLRPEVVHVWGATALRAVRLLARPAGRVVASAVLPPDRAPGRLDRWLLRGASVLALGNVEAGRYREMGAGARPLAVAAPAVAPCPDRPAEVAGLPSEGRVIACLGPFDRHQGLLEAVWALDILLYLYDDVHLALLGEGVERKRLAALLRGTRLAERAHFLGERPDVVSLLRRAVLVWVPGKAGGVNAALEALAAGRPVVAADRPALAEIIDEEVGARFPLGDKPALAYQTRLLLDDPERRRRLGEAGRRRAAERFCVAPLAQAAARLYREG
jgi:glycosyltransferase involved in cell wall biosynthesis